MQDIAMGLIRSKLLAIQQEQEQQRIAGGTACFSSCHIQVQLCVMLWLSADACRHPRRPDTSRVGTADPQLCAASIQPGQGCANQTGDL